MGISDVRKPEELLAAIFDSVRQAQDSAAKAQSVGRVTATLFQAVQSVAQEGKERWRELLSCSSKPAVGRRQGLTKVTVDARGLGDCGLSVERERRADVADSQSAKGLRQALALKGGFKP